MHPLVETHGLTEAKATFVEAYVETGDLEAAASICDRSRLTVARWLREPKVQMAIQAEVQQRLAGGAMKALGTLTELANDPNQDAKIRVQAAKDVLDRAGYKPEHMHVTADKRMDQQSVTEAMDRIKELQRELGMEAEGLPKPAVIDGSVSNQEPEGNQSEQPPGPPADPGGFSEVPELDVPDDPRVLQEETQRDLTDETDPVVDTETMEQDTDEVNLEDLL